MEPTLQNISLIVFVVISVVLALYSWLKINYLSMRLRTWKRLTNTNMGIISRDRVRIVSQAIAIEQLIKQLEEKQSIIDKNKDLENAFADCANELNLANAEKRIAYERLEALSRGIRTISEKSRERLKQIDELKKSKQYYKAKANHEKLPSKVNNSDQWLCIVNEKDWFFEKDKIYKERVKFKAPENLLWLECSEGIFLVCKSNFKQV